MHKIYDDIRFFYMLKSFQSAARITLEYGIMLFSEVFLRISAVGGKAFEYQAHRRVETGDLLAALHALAAAEFEPASPLAVAAYRIVHQIRAFQTEKYQQNAPAAPVGQEHRRCGYLL